MWAEAKRETNRIFEGMSAAICRAKLGGQVRDRGCRQMGNEKAYEN